MTNLFNPVLNLPKVAQAYKDKYNESEEIFDSTNLQIFSLLSFMEGKGFTPTIIKRIGLKNYNLVEEYHGQNGNLGFYCHELKESISFQDAVYQHNTTYSPFKLVQRIYLQNCKYENFENKVKATKQLIVFGHEPKGKSSYSDYLLSAVLK